jgi:glycosyltransferase involved in cell wall biosynthesis
MRYTAAMRRPALSVVIPCYNEAPCLEMLHARVSAAARAAVGDDHEIVLINDGSRDASWAVMQRLAVADPRLVAINLSRNHGHQLALTAGLDLCAGEQILIIDADLQDPPELLADMRRVMAEQGADVVYAVRRKRQGETLFKKATAALFYRLLDRLTDTEIPLDTGDFRLMSRRALDAFLALPEQARFIRGMVAWIGFRQVPFPYDRAERAAGETNYPFAKMLRLAFDAVTGFSTAPLRWASHVGLALTGVSLLLFVYIAIGWFTGTAVQGWTSTMLVTVFLGAVQMFVLGMIGEYLGRLYIESKRRPLYLVADIAGPVQGTASIGFVADQGHVPFVSSAVETHGPSTALGTNGDGQSAGTASVTSDTPGVIGTLPTR